MREIHDRDQAEEAARQARSEESRRGHDGVGDFIVEDDEARSSAVAEEPRSPAPSGDREGDVIGQDQRTSAPVAEGPPPTPGPTSPGDFIEDDPIAAPERAAPVDTNGWRPEQRDLDFLGQRQEQLDWLAERKALMGMTPDEYQEFRSSLLEALERDGVSLDGVDIRAHGSAANYYSSDKKPFDLEEIEKQRRERAPEGVVRRGTGTTRPTTCSTRGTNWAWASRVTTTSTSPPTIWWTALKRNGRRPRRPTGISSKVTGM